MNFPSFQRTRGFTLIELLVVISIIVMLASVVLTASEDATRNTRNAQRVATVNTYRQSLELYFDDHSKFPSIDGTYACLGATVCWRTAFTNDSDLDAALKPYVPNGSSPIVEGLYPGSGWDGVLYSPIYNSSGVAISYALLWFLEGTNQSCAPGAYASADGGNYAGSGESYCQYNR